MTWTWYLLVFQFRSMHLPSWHRRTHPYLSIPCIPSRDVEGNQAHCLNTYVWVTGAYKAGFNYPTKLPSKEIDVKAIRKVPTPSSSRHHLSLIIYRKAHIVIIVRSMNIKRQVLFLSTIDPTCQIVLKNSRIRNFHNPWLGSSCSPRKYLWTTWKWSRNRGNVNSQRHGHCESWFSRRPFENNPVTSVQETSSWPGSMIQPWTSYPSSSSMSSQYSHWLIQEV